VTAVTLAPSAVILGGYQAGLAVLDGLAAGGIALTLVVDSPREYARNSRRIARWVSFPNPERHEEAYLERLEQLPRDGERPLLVPTTDATLAVVSRHLERLGHRFLLSCMDAERVETLLDKERTYELAAAADIPVPRTFRPSSESEFDEVCEALAFPLLIKPRESHRYYGRFQRKMVKAADRPEALAAWR
jgi:predicted ATP-grasp superfamily ATP-dependent carboligase